MTIGYRIIDNNRTMSKYKKPGTWDRLSTIKKFAASSGYSFSTCYMELCKQQRVRPIPIICVNLPNSLEFTPDRLKFDDWVPILTSLSLDRILRSIKIHSRCQNRKPLEDVTSEIKARKVEKSPLFLTRYILERLSHSVAQCVRISSNLTCLELEGIPLTSDCVAVLCVGISGSKSLKHLSLCKSYIGDSGCELICQTLSINRCIKSLNLSQCNLTSRCGAALGQALLRQKLTLYHETWKQSLRYREPDLKAMPGLRRLTLNGNPYFGNCGTNKIIDAVKDSLWIKALDLQNCGLTDSIANDILELVNINSVLVVLDVRLNASLDERIVDEIMNKLDKNSVDFDDKSEYKWIGVSRKRINSAVTVRYVKKPYLEKPDGVVTRTTSAMAQQLPVRQLTKAVSARITPSAPALVISKRSKNLKPSDDDESVLEAKPSLLIDLQAEMAASSETVSIAGQGRNDLESETASAANLPATELTDKQSLLERVNNLDALLNEERLRRKVAEEKLLRMKRSVMQLENALKEKDQELRGYVLVSQDSLDEICDSFDQLLTFLSELTKDEKSPREDCCNVQDIQDRMNMLIRRTKSESIRRSMRPDTPRNFVKSDSNIRSNVANVPIYIERNIGDHPNAMNLIAVQESDEQLLTPVQRSRVVFSKLVSDDSGLHYNEFQY